MSPARAPAVLLLATAGIGATLVLPAQPPLPLPAAVPAVATVDPSNWGARRLAATLVLAGVDMPGMSGAERLARRGLGGIVLFGSPGPGLRRDLQRIRAAAPGRRFLVASDEEGGSVQRLGALLGRLPSAATIGATRTPRQARLLSQSYGRGMRRLGVNVSLAPVADLAVRGSFIAGDRRAFSTRPRAVSRYVVAWQRGLAAADVMATVKHWPGHGGAADTHVGSGRTDSWGALRRRELVPFRASFSAGVPAVMVGHLVVPGLTRGLPASLSRRAMVRLRAQAGPDALIMTDSLSMGAVTSALGQSATRAAVRSLVAGADVALVQSAPLRVVAVVRRAISSGRLPRAQAVAAARRVVAAQVRY